MMQTNKFNDYCIKNFVAFSVLEMSNPGKYLAEVTRMTRMTADMTQCRQWSGKRSWVQKNQKTARILLKINHEKSVLRAQFEEDVEE